MDACGAETDFRLPVPARELAIVRRMIANGINTIPTSSCGRLYDAVASISGLRQQVNYEGQAAIELEMAAAEGIADGYPFEIEGGGPWTLDYRPAIRRIAQQAEGGESAGAISARFHNTLAGAIVETCVRLRGQTGLKRVCLSGGTFQNMRLLAGVAAGLASEGFETFLHARVPPNDGGLALGQAAIAAELLK
jgi:hydrogenase maturation protein HypF